VSRHQLQDGAQQQLPAERLPRRHRHAPRGPQARILQPRLRRGRARRQRRRTSFAPWPPRPLVRNLSMKNAVIRHAACAFLAVAAPSGAAVAQTADPVAALPEWKQVFLSDTEMLANFGLTPEKLRT